VRRLIGITGQAAKDTIARAEEMVRESARLRTSVNGHELATEVLQLQKRMDQNVLPLHYRRMLRDQIAKLQEKLRAEERERASQSAGDAMSRIDGLLSSATRKGETTIVVAEMGDAPIDALKTAADAIKQKARSAAILFGACEAGGTPTPPGKVTLLAAVTDDLVKKGVKAGDWVKAVAPIVDGGGGGPPTMAQAGGKNPAKLGEALEAGKAWVVGKLS
jgi:alanyl-tRNA synthetase